MKKIMLANLASALTLAGSLALAQTAKPTVVRGTIDKATSTTLDLTTQNGDKMQIMLQPGTTITEVVPAQRADVTTGSYIGTAAVRQPDGRYLAMELQIFPAAKRGIGLGTRPWNLTKQTTMTNGTVASMTQTNGTVAAATSQGNLTLSVNDGTSTKTIIVPATAPVVTYAPGTMTDLAPGAHALTIVVTGADGRLSTNRVSVGKNGTTPPM